MRFEVTIKDETYMYDDDEIWEKVTMDHDMTDTILGYGTVYRMVSFGNIPLQDGTYQDILSQIQQLDDETIYKVMEDKIMIEGMKYHQIYDELFDSHDDWDEIDVTVKTSGGNFSFFGDSFERRILHPRGNYNYTELYNVHCVIDETNGIKYKPVDSQWHEVPDDEYTIIAHDPNPRRCGTYEAKIRNGKIIKDNGIECFFDEALSDLSWKEICQHDSIEYIYTDVDGEEYDGVVHII